MQATMLKDTSAPSSSPEILIRQLSHTATRVRDMAATKAFYEGVLGLPLVTTMVADFDVGTRAASNYIHCFFQMGDGSAIAFFQFEDGYRGDLHPKTSDPYERHIALRVDEKQTVDSFASRAEAAQLQHLIVDHDDFYSLYLTDPDGEPVEITWHKPSFDSLANRKAAAQTLEEWLSKLKK